jgi:hypothetical protein
MMMVVMMVVMMNLFHFVLLLEVSRSLGRRFLKSRCFLNSRSSSSNSSSSSTTSSSTTSTTSSTTSSTSSTSTTSTTSSSPALLTGGRRGQFDGNLRRTRGNGDLSPGSSASRSRGSTCRRECECGHESATPLTTTHAPATTAFVRRLRGRGGRESLRYWGGGGVWGWGGGGVGNARVLGRRGGQFLLVLQQTLF